MVANKIDKRNNEQYFHIDFLDNHTSKESCDERGGH